MQTSLRGIAKQAREDKRRRFTNLSQLLTCEFLVENFRLLNKKAATGIDVTHQEYAKDLKRNITRLMERVRMGKYRARFVRRKYIKKPNGKLRPLGITVTEDKLLQSAVARILEPFTSKTSGKWLKAGVIAEDGHIFKPVEGTPQGGVINLILANVYLHYALDR